jgi:hypothetical protein
MSMPPWDMQHPRVGIDPGLPPIDWSNFPDAIREMRNRIYEARLNSVLVMAAYQLEHQYRGLMSSEDFYVFLAYNALVEFERSNRRLIEVLESLPMPKITMKDPNAP